MALKITPGMLRVSVTIDLPLSVAAALDQIQVRLADRALPLHILDSRDLHITVAFLGEILPSQVDMATQCITSACAEITPFDLQIAGLRMMPNATAPDVFWAMIAEESTGFSHLLTLRDYLITNLSLGHFDPDPHFVPHITLARLHANTPRGRREQVVRAISELQNFPPIPLRVCQLRVRKSITSPTAGDLLLWMGEVINL